MKKKLTRSILLVSLASIVVSLIFVLPRLYWAFEQRTFEEMRNISATLKRALELAEDKESFLLETKRDMPQMRLSWIDATGEVLYDSDLTQVSNMENHASREEVLEAIQAGIGSASRLSVSLGENTYYFAHRLSDGSILRVAKSERSIVAELIGLLPSFVLIALLSVAISIILAALLTNRLIEPISRLDLEHPEENEVDEELTPLLARLMQQNKRIQEQFRVNRENMKKTAAITENMAEGLIMLSAEGHIVSINQSAAQLLGGTAERFCGLHYILAYRDLDFHQHIKQVLGGQRNESKMALAGKIIHMLADPVFDEGEQSGAIILLLDITEHERADETRREFSANVSHELKTPLTTIAGYAEMMQAGLSDARDNVSLAGKILMEARRLLALIEDIIKLSRLDENTGYTELIPVNLLALAQSIVERMKPFALEKNVSITLSGETQYVMGSPTLLEEMIQNLVDNAIRYNNKNGKVGIVLSAVDDQVKLSIMDAGLGIAPEHHARIFERFYRVDKSHSRETGGTGLGLSIVKHCVQNHGGKLSLESQPGKGTSVEVVLPRCNPADHSE